MQLGRSVLMRYISQKDRVLILMVSAMSFLVGVSQPEHLV